jgi:hypothetical protein
MPRIGAAIVVAQDGPEAVRRGHLAQEASAWFGGERCFPLVSNQGGRNKVSGEHDQVGTKAADHSDRGMQGMNRKIGIVMEIAEQSDRETIQPLRPTWQKKILAHNARTIRFEQD